MLARSERNTLTPQGVNSFAQAAYRTNCKFNSEKQWQTDATCLKSEIEISGSEWRLLERLPHFQSQSLPGRSDDQSYRVGKLALPGTP